MADDALKKLEDRLTRLEAALSQQGGGGAGGVPPGGAVVDPAPWGGGWGWGYPHWPHPIVDPAVFHRPIVDSPAFAAASARIGPNVDPPPPDISRFSAAQLQASLHSIAAERARLDAMEALIQQHLEKTKQPG